ncbi:MAG: polyphosphate polymerase domain-containing protein [Bacteroidia bacterium]|nr:polyphosphate polymerase domain-containing protein [Bacteroidia bacterium]
MKPNQLEEILKGFNPYSLEEAEKISFMDRVDQKYVFDISFLPELLEKCKENYRILEIAGIRNHAYNSLYFDTRELSMYHDHQRWKSNRYKIRIRTYSSGKIRSFLEIKFKNNKNQTSKKRIESNVNAQPLLTGQPAAFIESRTPYKCSDLEPQVRIGYFRATLAHSNMNERVTVDTCLSFIYEEKKIILNNVVIAEVKKSAFSEKTPFMSYLNEFRIKEGGLSKYCIGMALLHKNLKQNNFKEKIRLIHKIEKS